MDGYLKLLYAIITVDLEKTKVCLLEEKIDPRIGDNDLFRICHFPKIRNLVRDVTIKRNWYEKQVFILRFEEILERPSDIPETIFRYINRFR
jgi:hypothetical protein